MSENWREPFTSSEMQAMRRAARDEAGILAETMALIRRLARILPFGEDALAAYFCVRDPATSRRVKLILLAALAYFVLPLDGLPDVIPLVGFTDDAAMLAAALTAVRGAITEEHRAEARAALDEARYSG